MKLRLLGCFFLVPFGSSLCRTTPRLSPDPSGFAHVRDSADGIDCEFTVMASFPPAAGPLKFADGPRLTLTSDKYELFVINPAVH